MKGQEGLKRSLDGKMIVIDKRLHFFLFFSFSFCPPRASANLPFLSFLQKIVVENSSK